MMEVSQYVLKSRDERRAHLDLNAPCSEIGGHSLQFRGLMSYYLGVRIPENRELYLCHACNNPKCSNVKHLYWGTPQDNVIDMREAGKHTSVAIRMYEKYEARGIKRPSMKGVNAKSEEHWNQFRKFFENEDLSKQGWTKRIGKQINRSPRTVRELAKKLGYWRRG